ncbi:uncharacterized protein PV09_05000 [Verruconis gallopava]|uniref:RING-type domain-containing protein n=1 Tax=Verruconis gallopava TaxID=253628 RepID=A0A0D2AWX8_9PEZI|nr:uncharacterized protein PV09_05000 [Verruconis gallopava]KIW03679.1 hypothetical protein PV09_05000 [Verruconis gallopava]
MDSQAEAYDLLLLVDATYSMSSYLVALQNSLPKIIQISQLTNCFARIGLLVYRDYSEANRERNGLLESSGWLDETGHSGEASITADELLQKARRLEPIGGGDYPEATKTGLAKAHQLMRADATTILLLYTDAPPHIVVDGNGKDHGSNQVREQHNLLGTRPAFMYTIKAPEFADWVSAANTLRGGDKKAHVFSFLDSTLAASRSQSGYYSYLSSMTHGACFNLTKSDPSSIAETTIDVLLSWMGVEKAGTTSAALPAVLIRYVKGATIKVLKNETDETANDYFWATGPSYAADSRIERNIAQIDVTSEVLKSYMPKKRILVMNFAERYKNDEQYRLVATEQIAKLIENDVAAISLNPVFGSLWRAICNDRQNPKRDYLLNAFSLNVEKVVDENERSRMKAWLEESYDFGAEIAELVESVPTDDRFPCVFLDPTLKHDSSVGEDGGTITDFKRDELLEIGRSCDYRILRRLGKVLTQLTYVNKGEDLPTHIRLADIPLIPLCLGNEKHGYKLFRILLHLIVPGTMLAERPAAVLAALAIKMGMKPLYDAASKLMLSWKDRWNNVEIPETWNTSCLSLLTDADDMWRERCSIDLLTSTDRELFQQLIAYKLAEVNLDTTLIARVGWTPEKTAMPIGPTVICRGCEYPRSVTIMAEKSRNLCGICAANDYGSAEMKERYIHSHVTKEDNSATSAIWVECSSRQCRAQYVLYNPDELRVRPKCFYCRQQKNCPWIECTTCMNRMVWPMEFRTREMRDGKPKSFQCVACSHGQKTIVDQETSAQALINENGSQWLLRNENNTLQAPFNKRSLFWVISTVGPQNFLDNIRVLPGLKQGTALTIKGKQIQNVADIRSQLQSWIDRRQAESVACSLCFSDFHRSKLRRACGRRGCNQEICEDCLKSWYGVNASGHIINPATLNCPFCRRAPTAKTLANHGMGIHAVGNLRKAVEDRGTWIYAWCLRCSAAKQYMERSCARGAPQEIDDFVCEECVNEEYERLRLEEEAARRALEAARREATVEAAAAEQRLRAAARNLAVRARPVKLCPSCNIPSQKTSGCDHLTCVCGAHWCWACGKQFDFRKIYDHLNNVHGGYYTGGDYGHDDDAEDEW